MIDDYTFADVDSNNDSDEENDSLDRLNTWADTDEIPDHSVMDDHDEL